MGGLFPTGRSVIIASISMGLALEPCGASREPDHYLRETTMYAGKKLSLTQLDNGIVELCFDALGAPVNVFNNATVAELSEALDILTTTEGVKGLLLTSAKSVFVAGADISEFGELFTQPAETIQTFFHANNDNLNRIEDLPFPSVVAINGFALGGGLEVCLAADFRVVSNKAKLGLPETGLGIVPGWGGTLRSARIMGLGTAMAWNASARHQGAGIALEAGLADQLAEPEQLRDAAMAMLTNATADSAEYRARRAVKKGPMDVSAERATELAAAAKAQFCKRTPQLVAPAAVIDLIASAASVGRSEAISLEGQLFAKLANSEQARALVGNFMSDQHVKRVAKQYAKSASLTLDKVAVIGAGIMGGGIAYQNALRKMPVVMKDIAAEALTLGMDEATKLLNKKVRQGRMNEEQKATTLALITPSLELDSLAGSKVIVEAVVENPKVKSIVLAELEASLASGGVLVSNTSTISISRLAESLKKPEQFAGLHFFNPVHAMPLVEVIRGEKTSDQTVADLVAYALALGKQPVVVNDCPGFLVNRVLFPYFHGFELLIRDGADFQQVDQAMQTWGWPMGPAYLGDVIGMDTLCHCLEVLAGDFPERLPLLPESILAKMHNNQRFGQKNGLGFYDYQKDDKGRPTRSTSDAAEALIAECRSDKADFCDEDIVIRTMLPMAIEMARCIEEGIVGSPAEADMSLQMGLGFPAFRGGVLRWMDEVGLATLCEWSQRFAHLGGAYVATETMQTMAAEGKTYY